MSKKINMKKIYLIKWQKEAIIAMKNWNFPIIPNGRLAGKNYLNKVIWKMTRYLILSNLLKLCLK